MWLWDQFSIVLEDAEDVVRLHRARAYMLYLIRTRIFADKSGDFIHLSYLSLLRYPQATDRLSWRSAALTYVYREGLPEGDNLDWGLSNVITFIF